MRATPRDSLTTDYLAGQLGGAFSSRSEQLRSDRMQISMATLARIRVNKRGVGRRFNMTGRAFYGVAVWGST